MRAQQLHFRVSLYVQCIHLIENERDCVLAYGADVSVQRADLFLLQAEPQLQVLVLRQQLVPLLK